MEDDAVTDVRSAALRGFRATVAELGGDADRLAAIVGLPADALDTDDQLVPVRAVVTLLDYAATTLDCPDLGLRVAARQDIGTLGPLALAIQASATAGEALDCTTRFLFVHSRTVALTEIPDPDHAKGVVALRYDVGAGNPVTIQGVDLGMGFLHRALTELLGGPYGLRSVDLPYRPRSPIARYESFFGAPVRIDKAVGLLRLPASIHNQPLKGGGNPHLRQLAEAFLVEQLSGHNPRATSPRVRAAIQQTLGTAPATVTTVAAMLALHPRTLQRRLAAEKTSFATLLDEVRHHSAHRYLTTTDLPLTQVTGLLGFSEQSALTHSCRRWWSATPTSIRNNSASEHPLDGAHPRSPGGRG
jgi:AraC-like DNA-binding protein